MELLRVLRRSLDELAAHSLQPSERYLSLIRDGAKELGLTRAWQEKLAAVPTAQFGTRAAERSADYERRRGEVFV